jgi:dinuclear metal center YbgI/SA1388 family protein
MLRNQLVDFMGQYLDADAYNDAAKNGLQVEGAEECHKIMTAVTASLSAIKEAKAYGMDTLIVHHGLLWKGVPQTIGGAFKERIRLLLEYNINLIAYHLPLDANLEIGNNRNLANLLKLECLDYIRPHDKKSIALVGKMNFAMQLRNIVNIYHDALNSRIALLGKSDMILKEGCRICICSGSGAFLLNENQKPNFDLLITGDLNEQCYHLSREYDIAVIALGHDASEQSGVRSLGAYLADRFGLVHEHYTEDRESEARIYESV